MRHCSEEVFSGTRCMQPAQLVQGARSRQQARWSDVAFSSAALSADHVPNLPQLEIFAKARKPMKGTGEDRIRG